jgi:predicted GNAT family acetyltransferase
MAEDECSVNPLDADPEGFRARYERRVRMGRVWVLVRGGELVFKADVMAETPEVIYVEGVFVSPRERRRGYGRRCLLQLGQTLLSRAGSVCLLVNERNVEAHAFYRSAGYKFRGFYETIYLHK